VSGGREKKLNKEHLTVSLSLFYGETNIPNPAWELWRH